MMLIIFTAVLAIGSTLMPKPISRKNVTNKKFEQDNDDINYWLKDDRISKKEAMKIHKMENKSQVMETVYDTMKQGRTL